jgi:hypothetical protein
MSIFNNNGPTKEFEGSRRFREIAQRRFEAKQANNQAIADAHRLPSGPTVTGGAEVQPQPLRPRVDVPGG